MTLSSRSHRLVAQLQKWRERSQWMPVLLARVSIGVFFCISGGNKLFYAEKREQLLHTLTEAGIPFPEFNVIFVALVEFLGGALLALGFLSWLWSAMLATTMVVAIVTVDIHSIPAGLSVLNWLSYFFFLPQVLYILIFLWLISVGSGKVSIDYLLARKLGFVNAKN